MKSIPLTLPYLDSKELNEIKKCLTSSWLVEGEKTREFERKFNEFQKTKYAISTTSCTAALHLSLRTLNLKKDDEVLVPTFSWVTSASAVEYVNAKIRFIDVNLNTYNIEPDIIEKNINNNTKAIIIVHLFGNPANMEKIISICKKYKLKIIEDAACGIGSKYKGKFVGNFGDFGCFSFHPRKLITTGEGGMITTNSKKNKEKLEIFKNHGMTYRSSSVKNEKIGPWTMSNVVEAGYNLRFNDLLASIGIKQIDKVKKIQSKRLIQANNYNHLLNDKKYVITPKIEDNTIHSFQSYVIRIETEKRKIRNQIMTFLNKCGISTRPGTLSIPRLDYFKRKYKIDKKLFKNSLLLEDTTITLPIYHNITKKEQDFICDRLNKAVNKYL
tara:strand:+ start:207 stop:1361 length:1155 start_codon:yes stop_codon:yes gene_type:complete